ncbi:hypothetical protein BSI_27370 [Bacillus inaquosorum KCTC 13429]|uniref:Uncharacterized protein n=1 Tax=Bacillus inaquosorum KCTC 13429 TaxID=1236548 RepID=A0A9W5LIG3_9BACI|nr:hypothetical protein BSI_27370 [Bacillus inaquosorum KCTC 13429]
MLRIEWRIKKILQAFFIERKKDFLMLTNSKQAEKCKKLLKSQ